MILENGKEMVIVGTGEGFGENTGNILWWLLTSDRAILWSKLYGGQSSIGGKKKITKLQL